MGATSDTFILSVFANYQFSLLSLLAIAFLLLMLSAYVKIVTVLGIVRVGLGVESLPSALITGGLAVVLAFFVMYPTLNSAAKAMDASLTSTKPTDQDRVHALGSAVTVWKGFLAKHAEADEVERFTELAKKIDGTNVEASTNAPQATAGESESLRILAPAFLISELKRAFATGLHIFLPFLVIDLFVGNILVALGLVRFNPLFVSFPFKLLVFVMADGWSLITTNLVSTYVG